MYLILLLLACVLVSLYNSALISWNIMYLNQSFDYPPPWEQCKMHSRGHGNISMTKIQCLRTVPYQYFWYHTTLDASSQVEEGIEMLVLNITLCLFATWVIVYIILIIRIRISVLVSVPMASFPLGLRTSNSPEDRFMYTHQCPQTREVQITKIPNHFQEKKNIENILILVAFSIGLGSIWHFPYLCHQNGGGEARAYAVSSFLLMYLILLLLVGIPLLYMEMIIGQWLWKDNIQAWKQLAPWLSGLGYSSTLQKWFSSLCSVCIL
ncbi:Sodium-dependent neutral amino acid transporter B(0)AT2 [Microtus ochrogaster]|uniref:Sodium-dependent neutral amino acid transporter B(0)AT2 n=1 Tax=Microtus ochrogaster TaxID=79684 RepID=A0A8J6L084_MICOH|nr:Sodium-dependent neutral amino acid transporter B(0)AT2 [Microtus ochrogaster]